MKQELLAPAGSLETFYAVIAAGADAVYLGGPRFGARAYAKNFTEEECVQAIHYAHLKGKKVYMTVNTLVKNDEFDTCIHSLKPYYEAGLDGFIVQDIGVLNALRIAYPEIELHASTQMSISNKWGAIFLKNFGVTRVVPSRELSLAEISRIRKEADIEVETFVHGALCYSYSGQCLMSSLIGGRSGNRGRCAQPCRLPYSIYDENKKALSSTSTPLSLKDLAMLPKLPDLAEISVDSLKIEGRMKQAEYAYSVVSLYRKYLDQLNGSKEYKIEKQDEKKLLDSGNRDGFTCGYYYKKNGKDMITLGSSAHSNDSDYELTPQTLQPIKEMVQGDFYANANEPLRLIITYKEQSYEFYGPCPELATNKPTTEEQIKKQINKTGNSLFEFSRLDIHMSDALFIPVSVMNQFRRDCFDVLLKKILAPTLRVAPIVDFRCSSNSNRNTEGVTLSIAGNLRKHLKYVLDSSISKVYLELDAYDLDNELNALTNDVHLINNAQKQCILVFPYVFREDYEKKIEQCWSKLISLTPNYMARSFDSFGYLLSKKETNTELEIFADETLYTYSDESIGVFEKFGCKKVTVPYELNKKEICKRYNASSEMLIYGRIPVMITANCVKKTCDHCTKGTSSASKQEYYYLKDRKNAFFLVDANCNNCGNIIYNCVPNALFECDLKDIGINHYRIYITDESSDEIKKIIRTSEMIFIEQKTTNNPIKDFTYGHFKRGVE